VTRFAPANALASHAPPGLSCVDVIRIETRGTHPRSTRRLPSDLADVVARQHASPCEKNSSPVRRASYAARMARPTLVDGRVAGEPHDAGHLRPRTCFETDADPTSSIWR